MSTFDESFDGRSGTVIKNITPDAEENIDIDTVDFAPYDNPDVAIDTSARFAKHEIVGGKVVRQKIGEDPTEVSISGVCTEEVAIKVDQLRNAKLVTVYSDRFDDNVGGLRCQVASTSTSPMEEGGAANAGDPRGGFGGEFLYSFGISLVEVDVIL